MIEQQKQAGAIQAGYNQMFYSLAALAAVGVLVSLFLRRPRV
jgi:hypothetical protein